MSRLTLAAIFVLALAGSQLAMAQTTPDTTQAHCAAAKAAAGTDLVSLYSRFAPICEPGAQPAQGAAAGAAGGGGGRGRGAAAGPRPAPARDTWYHEPAKVFDNLYFIGTKVHNAWALQTSDGLIIIDSLYEYATKDEMVDGLRKLGVNPATMKYLIISHGHGDHHGGAKFLQDEFAPRVVMGGPDWDLVERTQGTPPPKRDIVAVDGQKITLGDTSVTLYATPGHTAGTFSMVFQVKDNGRPHMIATWGGTALTANTPPADLKAYIDSAVKYRALLAKLGVEGIISNHSEFDNAIAKLDVLAARKPGGPNPFLTGPESVRRYMTVVEEVARAALALPKP
jgi:metallo-beta-lactamase class B